MMAADNLESLADAIETDVVFLARRAAEIKTDSGEETRRLQVALYETTVEALEFGVQAIGNNDQQAAESVLMMKDTLREQADFLLSRKAERLTADDPDYLELVRLEMGFIDQMRRIYTLTKRIAKVVLPPVLAQRD